jgi:hypothetical protein
LSQDTKVVRPRQARSLSGWGAGGRRWWAHCAITRINIELAILKNQIEEIMNVRGVGEKSFLRIKGRLTVAAKPEPTK